MLKNLDEEQKKRFIKTTKKIIFYLVLGFLYYLFVVFTDKKIPCLLLKITGKICPGCGITRMFIELFKGNISAAAQYNILVLSLLPIFILWGTYRFVVYVKNNTTSYSKPELVGLIVIYLITVAFWILRNTDKFSYLAPGV